MLWLLVQWYDVYVVYTTTQFDLYTGPFLSQTSTESFRINSTILFNNWPSPPPALACLLASKLAVSLWALTSAGLRENRIFPYIDQTDNSERFKPILPSLPQPPTFWNRFLRWPSPASYLAQLITPSMKLWNLRSELAPRKFSLHAECQQTEQRQTHM